MNVRLDHSWPRNGYEVTFYETHPLRVGRLEDGQWIFDAAAEDSTPEPSLFLSGPQLEALLREAEKVIPATHATERHLTDVIGVRDRLLALVELAYKGGRR